ncbi:MAG: hypothetical protein AAGC65_01765 [Mucilaginibacter sp.]|uniref:hypothetical protein n=1 Tax=Mucilaginibacter sp. TaxID=1882438 RepID=UPI0031A3C1C3
MLKASALYIVIIIALVIALLCSALILSAYFYKVEYQQKFRHDRLAHNLRSGVNILLSDQDNSYLRAQPISLFDNEQDSVSLQKYPWGIFDIGIVKAFIQRDTLYEVFSMANRIDSTKWSALYLIDEDRPLSLSGNTTIRGEAYLPKAGVKTAYVDNHSYTGNEKLVQGKIRNSERTLPLLSEPRLQILAKLKNGGLRTSLPLPETQRVGRSFRVSPLIVKLGKQAVSLQDLQLSGNVIIYSDTTLVIEGSAVLRNVLVFAPGIVVREGFHGNCQLFATDSISIAPNCRLEYPSCAGVLRDTSAVIGFPEKISIGENSALEGLVFSYEKTKGKLPPVISLGKSSRITGQVYSQGILSLKDQVLIQGNVMTSRFLYQNNFTAYENYLIGVTFDAPALSPYFLISPMSPVSANGQKILQWLETR